MNRPYGYAFPKIVGVGVLDDPWARTNLPLIRYADKPSYHLPPRGKALKCALTEVTAHKKDGDSLAVLLLVVLLFTVLYLLSYTLTGLYTAKVPLILQVSKALPRSLLLLRCPSVRMSRRVCRR